MLPSAGLRLPMTTRRRARASTIAETAATDVTSAENTPAFWSGTRLPRWMLPDLHEPTKLTLQSDAVCIATLPHNAVAACTRGDRSQHVVDFIESGYCSDTRMVAKITEKV